MPLPLSLLPCTGYHTHTLPPPPTPGRHPWPTPVPPPPWPTPPAGTRGPPCRRLRSARLPDHRRLSPPTFAQCPQPALLTPPSVDSSVRPLHCLHPAGAPIHGERRASPTHCTRLPPRRHPFPSVSPPRHPVPDANVICGNVISPGRQCDFCCNVVGQHLFC
jgi:hypothetical protein